MGHCTGWVFPSSAAAPQGRVRHSADKVLLPAKCHTLKGSEHDISVVIVLLGIALILKLKKRQFKTQMTT